LPPRTIPKSIVKSGPKTWPEASKNWLAQYLPIKKIRENEPKIYTPKSTKFVDAKKHKALEDFDETLEDEYDFKPTPPPLYAKNSPEGGLVGWLAVAGAFLLQFCTIGYLSTWNVFEGHYNHVALTDSNPAAVRWIGSFQLFFTFALSFHSSKLADGGYFHYVIMGGSGLFLTCLFLLSFVAEEQFALVFFLQGIGMGVGMGLVFVPSSTIALAFFRRWRGFALGVVMSGGAFGGMIFPLILRSSIPTWFGWRNPCHCLCHSRRPCCRNLSLDHSTKDRAENFTSAPTPVVAIFDRHVLHFRGLRYLHRYVSHLFPYDVSGTSGS